MTSHLPPRPAPQGDEQAVEAPVGHPDAQRAREARYAEAIHRASWPDGMRDGFPSKRITEMLLPSIMTVADEEQAELRARLADSERDYHNEADNHVTYFRRWRTAHHRAEAAEAALADARRQVERVEALATYLDALAPGDRHYARQIRAALYPAQPEWTEGRIARLRERLSSTASERETSSRDLAQPEAGSDAPEAAEGRWEHITDGSTCPDQFPLGHQFSMRATASDGQPWWCTTHQSALRWVGPTPEPIKHTAPPAPTTEGGER